jgi:hypothetical protein
MVVIKGSSKVGVWPDHLTDPVSCHFEPRSGEKSYPMRADFSSLRLQTPQAQNRSSK